MNLRKDHYRTLMHASIADRVDNWCATYRLPNAYLTDNCRTSPVAFGRTAGSRRENREPRVVLVLVCEYL